MNKLVKTMLVIGLGITSVLSGCSQPVKEPPGEIVGNPIFTRTSDGEKQYSDAEIPIKGLFNGKDIGTIGVINTEGELSLKLPDSLSDEILDSRPGTNIKGGGLSTIPDIRLWKSDTDFLLLVYVNQDYQENGTTYHRGWNYATNKHQKVNSTEGYKWIIMNENTDNIITEKSSKQNKKILILSSSPRKGGNSDLLCDQFIRGAQDAGHNVEKIYLSDMKINFFSNADYKDMSGVANPADDVPAIVEKMIQSDVIVMATPTYFYAMSGQMKTMIDRTYERHREMSSKEFYFIIAGADKNKEKLKPIVQEFRGFLEALENPVERGIIYGTGAWEKGSIEQTPAMNEAYKMGENS